MKVIIDKLLAYETLSREDAYDVMMRIGQGKYPVEQVAAFLTIFNLRPITLSELDGFRNALLDSCVSVDFSGLQTIDLCGTGGDGKNTFNISTAASFVVAGAGFKVAKHGNYGVSSSCGSSNLLEYLGYSFSNGSDKLCREIESANITFLHAPLFHPSMKAVASVRRNMKIRTIFNILGPLVNPTRPKNQIIGVFDLSVARLYNYLYQKGDQRYHVLHTIGGYDEISLTGAFKLYGKNCDRLIHPEQWGFSQLSEEDVFGGADMKSSADIFCDILNDESTPEQKNVVLANAALAIHTITENSIETAIDLAKESIESKKAKRVYTRLLSMQ